MGWASPGRKQKLREALKEAQEGRCCYCGAPLYFPQEESRQQFANRAGLLFKADVRRHTATFEHLQRLADGGTHRNDNLALACSWCNSHRGKRSWVEFKTFVERRTS